MASTGFLRRLYRGEANFDLIGQRKKWYIASAVIIVICIGSMAFRGFNFGIEFAGGSQFQAPVHAGVALADVRVAVEQQGIEVSSAQMAGQGAQGRYVVRTPALNADQATKVIAAVAKATKVQPDQVSTVEVSSSWGSDVTKNAIYALLIFLLVVAVYLWIRFEQMMAVAALLALFHDLVLTAGVYSLIGFEVTPGTVIGLLTILGFSLYDTVVVFDRVDENTRGILGTSRYTYGEMANIAVNQTMMRSINTSLIALLPVAGLLFVGAGLLGVGTLKDLALVLFVGMLTGAYSSLFLATPWLVDLKLLDSRYKLHAQRVLAKRAAVEAGKSVVDAGESTSEEQAQGQESVSAVTGTAPKAGAKPVGRRPTGGKRK